MNIFNVNRHISFISFATLHIFYLTWWNSHKILINSWKSLNIYLGPLLLSRVKCMNFRGILIWENVNLAIIFFNSLLVSINIQSSIRALAYELWAIVWLVFCQDMSGLRTKTDDCIFNCHSSYILYSIAVRSSIHWSWKSVNANLSPLIIVTSKN